MSDFTEPDPTIKEFEDAFAHLRNEITTDGVAVSSHYTLKTRVSVTIDDPNDDNWYEIVGLDVSQLMGCGCWSGIKIVIRKRKDD